MSPQESTPAVDSPAPVVAAEPAPLQDTLGATLEATTSLPPAVTAGGDTPGSGLVVSYAEAVEQAPAPASFSLPPEPAPAQPAEAPQDAAPQDAAPQEAAADQEAAPESVAAEAEPAAEAAPAAEEAQHAVQDFAEATTQAGADIIHAQAEAVAQGLPPVVEQPAEAAGEAFSASEAVASEGADAARAGLEAGARSADALSRAMMDSAAATARGLFELNSKMVDMLRANNEATLALWRATLSAGSGPDAVRAQAEALRRSCQITAGQWQELAETAARVLGEAWQPLQGLQTPPQPRQAKSR